MSFQGIQEWELGGCGGGGEALGHIPGSFAIRGSPMVRLEVLVLES